MPKREPLILNVNDDPATLYVITRTLRHAGFDVKEAVSGEEALAATIAEKPDLVVLDVRLPDIDGFEVARRLRADPATAVIPIIHLSATYQDTQAVVTSLESGSEGYLTMPVEPVVLIATINAHLRARRAEADLISSAREWQAMFDATSDGICLQDREGRIVRTNAAMSRILGIPTDRILGRRCCVFAPGETRHVEGCPFVRVAENRRRETADVQLGDCWFALVIDPLLDENGEVAGAVQILSDITEPKRSEQELAEARRQADAANRAKSIFLANMSHEIRTPMTAILGMAGLLLDSPLSSEQRDYLEMMRSSATALLDIINDILDFSRIERGKLELRPVDFSLADAVDETLKSLAINAHQKGLELSYYIPPDVPDALTADAGRLRQVLVNLVGNAVKFTPTGEIVVRVAKQAEKDGRATLLFSVTDTGIGIAPERQRVIFSAFSRGHDEAIGSLRGTGLGLAISSRMVAAMGGSIKVDSQPGLGSTFSFTIDVGVRPARAPVDAAPADLKGLRALIVDDNDTAAGFLCRMLSEWGIDCTTASDASRALAASREAQASGRALNLLLVDAVMPDTDGFALVDRLREQGTLPPLVMLLPVGHPSTRIQRQPAPYVMKPVRRSDLLFGIWQALEAREPGPPGRRPSPRTPLPLRVLVAEDDAGIQMLVKILLGKRGHHVSIVSNGQEAVDALEIQQFDVVLMDVRMPVLDGLLASEKIRQRERERGGHVPIIALTAAALQEEQERCHEAGMDGYLSKPFEPNELYDTVERLADPRGRERATQARP